MFAGLDIWEAALVGAVLAPTDASLAQTVIVDRRVPQPVRDGLNVESGLNDGIALPFVIVFIGLTQEATGATDPHIVETFLRALVLSALLGGLTGWLGGRLVVAARERGWIGATWRPLALLAIALLAYAAAVVVDGSGFIGAWVAGLAAGMAVRRRSMPAATDDAADQAAAVSDEPESTFIDGLGVLLTTASYLIFGALLLGPQLAQHDTAGRRLRRPGPDPRAHGAGRRSRSSARASAGRPSSSSAGSGRAAWHPSSSPSSSSMRRCRAYRSSRPS